MCKPGQWALICTPRQYSGGNRYLSSPGTGPYSLLGDSGRSTAGEVLVAVFILGGLGIFPLTVRLGFRLSVLGSRFSVLTKSTKEFTKVTKHSLNFSILYCIKEGYTSVEHPFSFDELEISVARNTDEEVMAAIDTLIDRELDLEGHVPDFMAITNVWVDEFTESSKFNALEESLKKDVAMAARSFVEHIYNHEFAIPEEWTPTNVKSVCLEIIPSSVTAEIEFFETYGKNLIEFLKFLGEKKYIHNSIEIIVAVEQFKKQIPIEANNPDNWGNAKHMMMAAKESGIDLTDQEAIDGYLNKMSRNFQQSSVPSTNPSLPSHNLFKGIGRNEKVVVKYLDGRIVENIKFKKVEKELKEGKCELIR